MTVNLNKLRYNKPLITRELILQEIREDQIYSKYIETPYKINEVINSPFRKDNIPSFGIFKNSKGQLIYNDFVLGGGDAFTFVKYLFGYKTWWETYSRIGIDFFMDHEYLCKNDMLKTKDRDRQIYYEKPKVSEKNIGLDVKFKNWTYQDKIYWKTYGISLNTLKNYNVFPIEYIFLNSLSDGKQKIIKADKLAYCYLEKKDNKNTLKIYQPKSKYKWINNHDNSVWQGWNQLPQSDDFLIITKSLKDVMSIHDVCKLPSVALQNEKVEPKHQVINYLKSRFNNKIFLLYDNDFDKERNWGQLSAVSLCDTYGLKNIVIPTKYKCKDFSDLTKKYGGKVANEILKELIITADNVVPY